MLEHIDAALLPTRYGGIARTRRRSRAQTCPETSIYVRDLRESIPLTCTHARDGRGCIGARAWAVARRRAGSSVSSTAKRSSAGRCPPDEPSRSRRLRRRRRCGGPRRGGRRCTRRAARSPTPQPPRAARDEGAGRPTPARGALKRKRVSGSGLTARGSHRLGAPRASECALARRRRRRSCSPVVRMWWSSSTSGTSVRSPNASAGSPSSAAAPASAAAVGAAAGGLSDDSSAWTRGVGGEDRPAGVEPNIRCQRFLAPASAAGRRRLLASQHQKRDDLELFFCASREPRSWLRSSAAPLLVALAAHLRGLQHSTNHVQRPLPAEGRRRGAARSGRRPLPDGVPTIKLAKSDLLRGSASRSSGTTRRRPRRCSAPSSRRLTPGGLAAAAGSRRARVTTINCRDRRSLQAAAMLRERRASSRCGCGGRRRRPTWSRQLVGRARRRRAPAVVRRGAGAAAAAAGRGGDRDRGRGDDGDDEEENELEQLTARALKSIGDFFSGPPGSVAASSTSWLASSRRRARRATRMAAIWRGHAVRAAARRRAMQLDAEAAELERTQARPPPEASRAHIDRTSHIPHPVSHISSRIASRISSTRHHRCGTSGCAPCSSSPPSCSRRTRAASSIVSGWRCCG